LAKGLDITTHNSINSGGRATATVRPFSGQKEDHALVEWTDNLSVGVLEIDIQHKLLFEKFNGFLQACQSDTDHDTVHRLFWFLEAYAVTHFGDEEKLMQRLAYPDYPAHRKQHLEFAEEIGKIKERLTMEGPTQSLISSMTQFISTWLIQHISIMDRAIGRFVGESEIS
jgi:hemerythrin